MDDFYVTISAKDTMNGRVNTPSDFLTPSPWIQYLEGDWECALVETTMECDFSPKSDRLYMCCDFIQESYVNGRNYPLLRNVETRGRYKKYLLERYTNPRYVRVRKGWRECARFHLLDDELNPVLFAEGTTLHCVLHFKRRP